MHFTISTTIACTSFLCGQTWSTVGRNAQHNGISAIAAQNYVVARLVTAVDQNLAGSTRDILAHYGAPMITRANTVFIPVRTTTRDPNGNPMFQVEVRDGSTRALKTVLNSDYRQPVYKGWIPSYSPGLSARNVYYLPGSGGTVYAVDQPDAPVPTITKQIAFYGMDNYNRDKADFDTNVMISTPIVSDRDGNIFFGFTVQGGSTALQSGVARIGADGSGSWVSAQAAAGGAPGTVPFNSVPALSNETLGNPQQKLYFIVSNPAAGYLVSVNATTLAPLNHTALFDPATGKLALITEDSSASPIVGLDGDVYYGVLESNPPAHNARGWLLHFDSSLSASKTPGAFGWDDTPSIVPSDLVPSYQGSSPYLVLTKYNNYKNTGTGDGQNKIAILDPNDETELDPVNGVTRVMNEVITILGMTPDGPPAGAVREWCINSAAIDRVTKSAIVNSEDGYLYRWDFTTNTFSQRIALHGPEGEAYTPTVIGPDGTSWAINDGYLFAITNHE